MILIICVVVAQKYKRKKPVLKIAHDVVLLRDGRHLVATDRKNLTQYDLQTGEEVTNSNSLCATPFWP